MQCLQAERLGVEFKRAVWVWKGGFGIRTARGRGSVCLCGTDFKTDFKTNSHLCGPELEEYGSFLHFCIHSLLVQEPVVAPLPWVWVWPQVCWGQQFPQSLSGQVHRLDFFWKRFRNWFIHYSQSSRQIKSSFTVFHLSAPYLFWVSGGPLWGESCQIGDTLCRLQKHFPAPQTRSDIQLWTRKRGLKYLFLFLLAKQNMHVIKLVFYLKSRL